jgi:hypothetical protein
MVGGGTWTALTDHAGWTWTPTETCVGGGGMKVSKSDIPNARMEGVCEGEGVNSPSTELTCFVHVLRIFGGMT